MKLQTLDPRDFSAEPVGLDRGDRTMATTISAEDNSISRLHDYFLRVVWTSHRTQKHQLQRSARDVDGEGHSG